MTDHIRRRKGLLMLALLLSISVSGCAGSVPDTAMDRWAAAARLDARETAAELHEKALGEDTLVIYSDSTRVMDVKDSFERQYPDLSVYIHDVRSSDLVQMLEDNAAKGTCGCDIVLCSDNDGSISQSLVPRKLLYKYVPFDIHDKLVRQDNPATLVLMGEILQLFYNPEAYASCPVKNWWELTEERFRGRVVIPSPLKSFSTSGFIFTLLHQDALLAKAYEALYGKPITLAEGETAGQAFWRRLLANGLIIANSSDEVIELVGARNLKDPPVGIMISSKARMRALGYAIEPAFDVEPFAGTYSPNSIMIAGGSRNINSAKLFIRWILGESDGQGEGYRPYLQDGAWSARRDVSSATKTRLEDLSLLYLDPVRLYGSREADFDFWRSCLSP